MNIRGNNVEIKVLFMVLFFISALSFIPVKAPPNGPPTHDSPIITFDPVGSVPSTLLDLIANPQNTVDPDGDPVVNIYNWYRDGESFASLNMPFDLNGLIDDYSTNGNTGTVNGATWTTPGVVGGAYSLDGINDYLSITDSADVDGGGSWTEFTVEFWVNPGADQAGNPIIYKDGSFEIGFKTGRTGNQIYFGVTTLLDTTTSYHEVVYAEPLDAGTWHHIVCTYRSYSGSNIYVNGEGVRLTLPYINPKGNVKDSTSPLLVGTDSTNYLDGVVDGLKIYPSRISNIQANQNYLESKDGLSDTSTIVSQQTQIDDLWQCGVTPVDLELAGETKLTDVKVITANTNVLGLNWVRNSHSTARGVVIYDVDSGEPGEEIILTGPIDELNVSGRISVYSGIDGEELYSEDIPGITFWSLPEIADIDSDGVPEIIVPIYPYDQSGIHVFNAEDLTTVWRLTGPWGQSSSALVVGDINGDGEPTIFFGTTDIYRSPAWQYSSKIMAINNLGEILYEAPVYRLCGGGLSLADTDHDGVYELYGGDRDMYYGDGGFGKGMISWWADNLTIRWYYPEIVMSSNIPIIADVTKDGIDDIIGFHLRGGILVVDGATGRPYRNDLTLHQLGGHYEYSVYDIDLDGNLEIMIGDEHSSTSMDIIVWDLVEWKEDFRVYAGSSFYGPMMADVDNDGNLDMIVATDLGVFAYNHEFDLIGEYRKGTENHLNYANYQDIDDDGKMELVFSAQDGYLYTLTTLTDTPDPSLRPRSETQFFGEHRRGAAEYYPLTEIQAPVVHHPVPGDGAIDIPLDYVELVFDVTDYQADTFTYTVSTAPDITGVVTVLGQTTGQFSVPITGVLTPSTSYEWTVTVNDGENERIVSFTFETVQDGWYSQNWKYRKTVTIDHTLVPDDLTDYPVYLDFTDLDLDTYAQPDGDDIMFTNLGYDKYSHELVSYTTGTLEAWVLIPSVSSTVDTEFYIYYGNDEATSQEDPAGVWSGYGLVMHMDEEVGSYIDSAHGQTGTPSGDVTEVTGTVGAAASFDGAGDSVEVPYSTETSGFDTALTLSTVVKLDNMVDRQTLLINSEVFNDQRGYYLDFYHSTGYWSGSSGGEGSIDIVEGEEAGTVTSGQTSQSFQVVSGDKGWVNIQHGFPEAQDWTAYDKLGFYWYGQNSGATFSITVEADTFTDRFTSSFTDNFNGWQKIELPFSGFTQYGSASWGNVKKIIILYSSWLTNTWYMDLATVESATETLTLWDDENALEFMASLDGVTDTSWETWPILEAGQYYHVSVVWETGTVPIFYINGVMSPASPSTSTISQIYDTGRPFYLGGRIRQVWEDDRFLDGILDEVQVTPTAKTPDWIKTEYNNLDDPSSFTSISGDTSVNNQPIISKPSPNNGAVNVPVGLVSLEFTLGDGDGDTMDWTVITDPDIGFDSGSGTDGSYSATVSGLAYDTTFTWTVTATDDGGTTEVTKIYTFTTVETDNNPPTQGTPSIETELGTNTANEDITVTSVDVSDPDPDLVTSIYNWYVYGQSITVLNMPFDTESTSVVKDYSPYGNDAYLVNATWSSGGVVGGCYVFDSSDDVIKILDSDSLDGTGSRHELTIEFWANPTSDHYGGAMVYKIDGYEVGFEPDTGANRIYAMFTDWEKSDYRVVADTGLTAGTWSHITVTYDNVEGAKIYVDGLLVSSTVTRGTIPGSLFKSEADLDLARYRVTTYESYYRGSLDQLKIYNRRLVPEQVYQNWIESKDGDTSTSTIVAEEAQPGETWRAEVIVNDGETDGTTETTATIALNGAATVTITNILDGATDVPLTTTQLEFTIDEPEDETFDYSIYTDPDIGFDTVSGLTDGTFTLDITGLVYNTEYTWTVTTNDGINENIQDFAFTTERAPDMVAVVRGLNDGIYYRSYSPGDGWGTWKSVPGKTFDSPAATLLGDNLHFVIIGNYGTIYHGWVNTSTDTFSGWTKILGVTPSAPSLSSDLTHLFLTVRSSNNKIVYTTYDGTTWSSWITLSGATVNTPATTVQDGKMNIVVTGSTGNLFHGYVDIGTSIFSGWTKISGATPSAPVLTSSDDKVYLVVRGLTNKIYYRSYDTVWSNWEIVLGATDLSPGAVVYNDELYILVRGITDRLFHGWVDLGTSSFSGWTKISGGTPSMPRLVD